VFVSLLAFASARVVIKRAASTATDVTDGACKPVTLIFARGTTEPGNLGTVVGPPLAAAMKSALGDDKVAVQGVDYAADIAGATSGAIDPQNAMGAQNMAALAQKVTTACPTTKVVLSGYSQGAEEVRGALMAMDKNTSAKVAAAVTFGDPLQSQPFANIDAAKTKINCAPGDQVCNEKFQISAAHLSYGTNGDIPASVKFIQSAMA